MKKKVLGLTLIALSAITFSSMASSQNAGTGTPAKECMKSCGKKEKCDNKKKGGCKSVRNPFEGMNLNESQQAKLRQLDENRARTRAEKRSAEKAAKDNDRRKRHEERRAARKQYLQDVKSIIGQDNYVIFLENMVLDSPKTHKGNMRHHARGKHGNDHRQHDRQDGKQMNKPTDQK